MNEQRRPLRTMVLIGDKLLGLAVIVLVALMFLYSAYSIWYTSSLKNGSFLSDELAMYKPTGQDPTLKNLAEMNSDVRGWITIDGTNIDYPVVQGEDDAEYLNKDIKGDFSLAGAIFLASSNTSDFSDPYNLIYGHHIEGGAMFSDVLEFRKDSYFRSHRTGTLWLLDGGAYHIDIISCMEVHGLDEVIYQDSHKVLPENMPEFGNEILARSVRNTSFKLGENDSVIAMSTCEDADSYDRVVLVGRLTSMTPEEINELQKENLDNQEEFVQEAKKSSGLLSFITSPWVLVSAGAFLILIMVFIISRKLSSEA